MCLFISFSSADGFAYICRSLFTLPRSIFGRLYSVVNLSGPIASIFSLISSDKEIIGKSTFYTGMLMYSYFTQAC